MRHFARLNFRNELLPSGSLKVAARIAVIGVMDDIFIALLGGVPLKVFLLIDDRIAVAGKYERWVLPKRASGGRSIGCKTGFY